MNNQETGTSGRSTPRILIADDQADVLTALRVLLKGEGYEIQEANSPAAIWEAVNGRDFDVVLMDLNYVRGKTSGDEGLDLLQRIGQLDSTLPLVVMTAWGSIELAVETMRRGARDFVEKPWNNERLLSILRTQTELGRALKETRRLEQENLLLRTQEYPQLIADSKVMQPVLQAISRVGPSEANVLITGENGSGKNVVAQALHSVSKRADKQMVRTDVGGLSEPLFESELFGHVKGAFTDAKFDRAGRFEIADGGTLLLDEISNISLSIQGRLLRVIETGQFERVGSSKTQHADVRIISATNANLQKEVAEGRFRQDLLYRLNTVEIHIPPLRERKEDIPLLGMHFLREHRKRYRKTAQRLDSGAMELLLQYPFPGNVRELDHAIERAVLMAETDAITASDLGLGKVGEGAQPLEDMPLEKVEALLIKGALERHDGNVARAAKDLGLSRSALYRRLEKHGL
jgi:DNA-binding NtrC family response regulator